MTPVELLDIICKVVFWAMYFYCGWDAINATFKERHILYRIVLVPLWMPMYFVTAIGERLQIL